MISYADFSERSLTACRYLAIITAIAAPVSTAVSSVASIGLLVCWLISGQALQTLKLSYHHPVGKTILVFVAWLIISAGYADNEWSAKITTLLSWKKLFFVFILLGLFNQQLWQQRFIYGYVGFMALAAVVALPLWVLDINVRAGATGPGIFMTNWSAQSLAFVAALVCCMFLSKQLETIRQKRYVWAAIALLLFNILFVSSSRSGYLVLFPAMIFAGGVIYGSKKLPHILTVLVGILIVAGISSTTLQQRIKLALAEQNSYQSSVQTSSEETAIGARLIYYKHTLELIADRPIFGYGTSSFEKTYSAHVAGKYPDWRSQKSGDPHNQYLFIWLENGLIGLLLFFVYIYVSIREGLRSQPYGPIAASFLVAVCVSSLFNSHFKTFAEGNLLAFFMGALLAYPLANATSDKGHA